MQRIQGNRTSFLNRISEENLNDMPQELKEDGERFSLLYDVPLAYLVPSPDFLPSESLRFFYVDENFSAAMQNGFLSVGRNSTVEQNVDEIILNGMIKRSRAASLAVRRRKVHENHHKSLGKFREARSEVRSGFLLRSALVYRRKGLVISGYHGEEKLPLLRLETLNREIMLGIFDGELTSLTVSEPQCGLRFGCKNSEGKRELLSLKEIGKPLEGCYCQVKTNDKGRMDVKGAAQQIEKILREKGELTDKLSSHLFAYEFFLAAQKAEFLKKEEG